MLALYIYVTRLLPIVYLEVIALNKFYLFTRKTPFLQKNKCQEKFPTNMLASFEIHNSFASDLYMDVTADSICKNYQYFIQQQHDKHFVHLSWHYCVSTSDNIY